MKTAELIAVLAGGATPVSPGAARRRLVAACLIGAAMTAALFLTVRGVQPGSLAFARTAPFWMKTGYTVWLAIGGYLLAESAARPGLRPTGAAYVIGAALLSIICLAAMNLIVLPSGQWPAAWMGHSALICPFAILISATPAFVAVVLVMRGLAPTRLGFAGAAAGLLAGGVGAAVYALWCRETAAIFVATWYTLGVAACGGIGALLGPKILRW